LAGAKDWLIPEAKFSDTAAIQALSRGEANADQQKAAIKYIIEKVCMTYDETFHLTNERVSSFYQGRRFCGNQIIKEINIDLRALTEKLKQKETKEDVRHR